MTPLSISLLSLLNQSVSLLQKLLTIDDYLGTLNYFLSLILFLSIPTVFSLAASSFEETMMWSLWARSSRVRKSGDGLQAITWWKNGEINKIRKYCLDDVKITKEIYEYAIKNNLLKYKEGGKINEIKLDTTGWEKRVDRGLNHTLPF